MSLPEVGLEDHDLQFRVGPKKYTKMQKLEGNGVVGSCAGRRVIDESTEDFPDVFACLN